MYAGKSVVHVKASGAGILHVYIRQRVRWWKVPIDGREDGLAKEGGETCKFN